MSLKRLIICGGTGTVGKELGVYLVKKKYDLHILTRDPESCQGFLPYPCQVHKWTGKENLPKYLFSDPYGVINLAGESLSTGRWSQDKKEKIVKSRVDSIANLRSLLEAQERRPDVWIQASATGIYGDRGDDLLTEESHKGEGFLSHCCQLWEQELKPIIKWGTRVSTLRIGPIFSRDVGFLDSVMDFYHASVGSNIAGGKQWVSWIHMDDVVSVIYQSLVQESYSGVFNVVSPNPIKYDDLHKFLKIFFGWQIAPPVPGLFIKLLYGSKSDLILKSVRVSPEKLMKQKFQFKFKEPFEALEDLLGGENYKHRNCKILYYRQWSPLSLDKVWDFFSTEKNLEKLTPPWLNFAVEKKSTDQLKEGSIISYRLRLRGLPLRWQSKITDWQPGQKFRDFQIKGPYKVWDHTHQFEELGGGTLMTDIVRYQLPLPMLSSLTVGLFVKSDLKKIFHYRQKKFKDLFFEPATGL